MRGRMSKSGSRSDGRASNDLRPPHLDLRPLLRADGSARFSLGGTVVICAIAGPRESRVRSRELPDRAFLEVLVKPAVGSVGLAERNLEHHLQLQFEDIIQLKDYPHCQITIHIQFCSVDGSTWAVAGNAAFLALLDAGIAMRSTVLNVAIGVQFSSGNSQAHLLLDPTEVEERNCDTVMTVALDTRSKDLVSNMTTGAALDAIAWASCVAAGSQACTVLEAFLRMSLQKRLDAFLKSGETQ